jgi:hypothetical protein
MSASFQTVVNPWQSSIPLGVEGDFCSANPRSSMLAGEGALTAGAVPVTVGRFGFVDANGHVTNAAGGSIKVGFIGLRGQMVLITPWLGGFGLQVQPGYEMTMFDSADVFIRFAAGATVGQKVFASTIDGTAIGGAAGATIANALETRWFVDSLAAAGELAMCSTRG